MTIWRSQPGVRVRPRRSDPPTFLGQPPRLRPGRGAVHEPTSRSVRVPRRNTPMARRPHLSKRNDATDAPTRALRRPSLVRRPVALLVTVFATLAFVGGVATFGASASGAATDASANSVRPVSGAPGYGPDPGLTLNAPLVAIDSTPSGHGYWAAAADGGVFAKGDARYEGGAAGLPLVGPVVGISGTPDGGGYWLVAADGGVFSYGDADFFGSLGGYHDG